MYRVTIEKSKEDKDPETYHAWMEVYQQMVEVVDVPSLITTINKKDQ